GRGARNNPPSSTTTAAAALPHTAIAGNESGCAPVIVAGAPRRAKIRRLTCADSNHAQLPAPRHSSRDVRVVHVGPCRSRTYFRWRVAVDRLHRPLGECPAAVG